MEHKLKSQVNHGWGKCEQKHTIIYFQQNGIQI